MRKNLRACTSVLLGASILAAVASADTVYRAGGSSHQGQTVNSYTNAGAEHYRQSMRSSRSGQIYNLAPKPTLRASTPLHKLKIPSSVSYTKSLCQELPDRYVGNGSARVNLSEIVKKHSKTYNLDPLLVEEVIRQESNFQPTATSRVGAQGLMQLMPGTASMLGVRDSNDPDQNIAGGARYLAEQLTRFGRLDYALAAYNAGPGAVASHGGIPPYAETRNYVVRIVNSYNNRVRLARKNSKSKSEEA
jgi:soluble lytic murein transglycosylase-like protein